MGTTNTGEILLTGATYETSPAGTALNRAYNPSASTPIVASTTAMLTGVTASAIPGDCVPMIASGAYHTAVMPNASATNVVERNSAKYRFRANRTTPHATAVIRANPSAVLEVIWFTLLCVPRIKVLSTADVELGASTAIFGAGGVNPSENTAWTELG